MLINRTRFRLTGCLAVVSYLLAATGSSLLHDHAHSHDEFGRCVAAGHSSVCVHSHRHYHHGHCHNHHHGRASDSDKDKTNGRHGHSSAPGPLHDDDCAVCQFLAQKPLIATVTVAVASGEFVADMAPTFEAFPAAEPATGPRPRGPPACA